MRWFPGGKSRAVRMAESAHDRLVSVRKQIRTDLKKLKSVEKSLKRMQDRIEFLIETTAEDVEDCEARLSNADKALEALRSEHEIATKVEVPRLMTALQRFQASDEAEIAVHNYRRAGATPAPLEGEH